ncbi:beta-carotene isomerase D27, chloroplastic isoform X2 [Corylus avellana]|uniref:beta-carotene isomerase D27, chloroplastic isoform X2 n=1 Tax=Corylus avellana TaxID=13451 RepID=UPI00286B03FB|nr:beta-carotene isomerase D27, chloroplastic isoform X2 [Corylus avellana]
MDAKFVLHTSSPFSSLAHRSYTCKPPVRSPPTLAVLTSPTETITQEATKTTTSVIYNDNWFDKIAINHLSQSVQAASGLRNSKSGYESLVEAAKTASHNFNPIQQRDIVIQALQIAFPRPILSLIKTVLPQSKLAREYFAVFTTVFFAWLVGPCEVRESELNGRREMNVVHIKKCRFLEESNCVGLCTNLYFEDMSCEMIFGQDPPASSDDPAFKQPCYKLCKANVKHNIRCSDPVRAPFGKDPSLSHS